MPRHYSLPSYPYQQPKKSAKLTSFRQWLVAPPDLDSTTMVLYCKCRHEVPLRKIDPAGRRRHEIQRQAAKTRPKKLHISSPTRFRRVHATSRAQGTLDSCLVCQDSRLPSSLASRSRPPNPSRLNWEALEVWLTQKHGSPRRALQHAQEARVSAFGRSCCMLRIDAADLSESGGDSGRS